MGGADGDLLNGGDGMDILVGDSVAVIFSTDLRTTGLPLENFWSHPLIITSLACQYGGEDIIYGGKGAVDYM